MKHTQPGRPTRKRAVALMSIVAVALSAGACGGGDDRGATNAAATPAKDTVDMKLIAFKPDAITVEAGGTVTWRQNDPGVHTVTSGAVKQEGGGVKEEPDGLFDSGQIATDKTFQFTFEDPGTFAYFCAVHPATMRGEVTVT